MGLLDDCEGYFGSSNLYDVLGLTREASQAEIKKAYKKASLLCHPDRVSDDKKEEATRKFQVLSKVHCILSDEEAKSVYDETGCIDEEGSGLEDKDWANYWRLIFPKITLKDIDNFFKKYKGSKDELLDLKNCYNKFEGDMNKISECFIGYSVDEEDRIQNTLKELIKKKEIPDFPKFTKESKAKKDARAKRLKKEAAEAEEMKEDMDQDLMMAITQRRAQRENNFNDLIQNLEAKYCKTGGAKKKKK